MNYQRNFSDSVSNIDEKTITRGKVIASTLNLRHSASKSAAIDEVLKFGTEVTVIKSVGKDWYKIKVDSTDKIGYVMKQFIEEI